MCSSILRRDRVHLSLDKTISMNFTNFVSLKIGKSLQLLVRFIVIDNIQLFRGVSVSRHFINDFWLCRVEADKLICLNQERQSNFYISKVYYSFELWALLLAIMI